MAIVATYISATNFSVDTDRTAEFGQGRAIYADCGVDGIKYGYVNYPLVSGETTVVNLISGESQALTANLAEALYSRVKLQKTSGNDALETIWLMRGKQSISVSYKDADEITLGSGVVHINDGTNERLYHCAGFDKQLTSLGTSEWRYIYAKPPAIGALVLSATEIEHTTTAPTEDTAKRGWYHPTSTTWRCIGFARITAAGAILPFSSLENNVWLTSYDEEGLGWWLTSTQPSNTWTTYTFTPAPLASITLVCYAQVAWGNASYVRLCYRYKGRDNTGMTVSRSPITTNVFWGGLSFLPINADKQAEFRFESATTNWAIVSVQGFVIPKTIYNV